MCNPVAMFAISAFQAFGQYQQGKAAAKAERISAANNMKVAEFNANIEKKAGADAIARGAEDSAAERLKALKANATLRANLSGLADTGTSLQLQGQNAGIGEVNALTVMNNAEREKYGHDMEAQSILFSGKANQANAGYRASVMKQNGLLEGLGTFATGTANYGKSQGWFSGGK